MENIWKKWEKHYQKLNIDPKNISKDGILTEKIYWKTKPKILFVLKDTDRFPGGDLRELLKDGPIYQMWHTIARWASGILLGFPNYQEINKYEIMSESLAKTAIINMKKISGGPSADYTTLNLFAKQDKELLLEQIDAIKPDCIVTCGTFNPLLWVLDLKLNPSNPLEQPIYYKKIGSAVVPWRHPNRANNNKTYLELKEIFRHVKL